MTSRRVASSAVRSSSENSDTVHAVDQIATINFVGIIANRISNKSPVLKKRDKHHR
jgi:hypothetical protein